MDTENKVFAYGSFTGSFDTSDYVMAEKWEDALEALGQKMGQVTCIKRESQKIKHEVEAIAAVFDCVFGEGAANQVLGGSTSLNEAIQALAALHDYVAAQGSETAAYWQSITAKYSPANREQRRAAGKSGK